MTEIELEMCEVILPWIKNLGRKIDSIQEEVEEMKKKKVIEMDNVNEIAYADTFWLRQDNEPCSRMMDTGAPKTVTGEEWFED